MAWTVHAVPLHEELLGVLLPAGGAAQVAARELQNAQCVVFIPAAVSGIYDEEPPPIRAAHEERAFVYVHVHALPRQFGMGDLGLALGCLGHVAHLRRTRVGPFFGWRFAFLGYNIDLQSVFMNSDDTDLSASIYSAAFGLDLFYRRVGGNYNVRNLIIDGSL